MIFGVVTVDAQAACSLFGQRASACTVDQLFVRLASLCLEVCQLSVVICHLSKHFSAVHSIVIV